MESATPKKIQRKKPENMSEEQWEDYQSMREHPGKTTQGMTGSYYVPSNEEKKYYKKWTSEADKARIRREQTNKLIVNIILFILFIIVVSLFDCSGGGDFRPPRSF